MKRWHSNGSDSGFTEIPEVDVFLEDVNAVFSKHGMCLSHEDVGGAFVVESFSNDVVKWVNDASVGESIQKRANVPGIGGSIFEEGAIVQLNSGGPKMTVTGHNFNRIICDVKCSWFLGGLLCQDLFPGSALIEPESGE